MAEACAASVANKLASKLGEYMFAHVGHQFGYVLCYKSYLEDLKIRVKELDTVRERVQHLVDEAMNDGKPIHTDIKNWMESVEIKAKEAENLIIHGESANISCFHGWLPNPVVRHPIGRKVKKMTRLIQGLHNESTNSNFQKVFYENTPTGIVTTSTSFARFVDNKEVILESRASIIEDVMKAIADDKVRVIGVHGPGGVGKSKLLEDIERQIKEEKLFDVVAKADVSRNLDIKRIQGEIAHFLGLKLMDEETTRGRANLLCKRIENGPNKNILIILDNLWKKLDLKEVGIPCEYDNKVKGCKLLLTSRYRDVLLIDMGSDREFPLNKLEDQEARRLFESIVEERVNDPEFKPLVDGVVKNCGGLPILIVSLAKRLKHEDLPAWRNALAKIDGADIKKSIVGLNYNDLKDDRIKLLFLVCALACGRIDIRDSLVYCMGLGLYKEFSNSIEKARDRLIMDLRKLQDSSLLLDSSDMELFRMHDIFVDEAISIASTTEWSTLVCRKDFGLKEWSKDELRKCTVISFPYAGIDELPEKLDCPNLKMLLLFEHNASVTIPVSFFESMEKLQVLDLTGLSFTSLPSSIEFLENLKSLCLDGCHLENVTLLGKLKGLQFLSLIGSTIARLPKEIGELTKLRFLDLRMCTRLKVIEPGVLKNLVNLEELYMEDSFDQWEAEDKSPRSNVSLAELRKMQKLSTLYIAIPHSAILSRDLPFGKLNSYKIQIGDVWDWLGEYKESKTLKLKLNLSNRFHEEWVQSCLQKAQDLHLDGLQDGSDSIHDLCIGGFHELKHLHVRNSPSIAYVVRSNVQCTAFTRLESLFLENLKHLKEIWCGCLASESLIKLKTVKVDNCGEIRHLFPSSMMRVFLQLEEIEISTCHLMQNIVADAEADEVEDEIDDDPKVKSCNVRRLTLRKLPGMMSFWKSMDRASVLFGGHKVIFPNLEELTLSSLRGLRRIWTNDLPKESFSKLTSIMVGDCENLSHIFQTTLIERFKSLKMIEVSKCAFLEALVEHVTVDSKKGLKGLVLLVKEVKLWHLPRLNTLVTSSIKATLSLPSLTNLSLSNCHGLKYLFSDDTARTLEKLEMLDVSDCDNMQEVVAMEEGENQMLKAVKFSHLRTLRLRSLRSLISFSLGSCAHEFPTLKEFTVEDCKAVEVIVGNVSCKKLKDNIPTPQPLLLVEKVEFPSMEFMKISHMDNVKKIWLDEVASNAFSKLKTLIVEYCEKISSIFSSETIITGFQNLEKHVWSGRPHGIVTFERLRCLKIHKCESLQSLFPSSVAKSMVQLEELMIWDCGVKEIIAEEDAGVGTNASDLFFPRLTDLRLVELPDLKRFFRNSHTSHWPLLKELQVEHCNKMKSFSFACEIQSYQDTTSNENQPTLFSFEKVIPHLQGSTLAKEDVVMMQRDERDVDISNLRELVLTCYHDENDAFPSNFLLQKLPNLDELNVNCSFFEEIFPEDAFGHGGGISCEGHTDMKKPLTVLKYLKRLGLRKLCNLRRVWKDGSLMAEILKQIEELHIFECHNLSIMIPSPTSFQSLGHLHVENCTGLVHMGTCFTVTSLVHLTELILKDCGAMEDMVTNDGDGVEEISLLKLHVLVLDGLPILESFSPTNCTFRFPSLVHVIVKHCPKMNIFCKGALSTPKLNKVLLSKEDDQWHWKGDLNTTIQTLSR